MILSTVIEQLLGGMVTSIEIFLLTLLFSLPLGLLIAGGRMSRFRPLRWLMKIYISIMRGTPLMLQLIVVFFGPYYIFGRYIGVELNPSTAANMKPHRYWDIVKSRHFSLL